MQGSDCQRPRAYPYSKFSFRLYFRGDYGPGRLEYPLFPGTPVESFDQLVLRAGFNDNNNPFIRDELRRRLFNQQGQITAHFNELKNEMALVLPGMDQTIVTTWVAQRRGVLMPLFNTYGLIASSNAPGFNQFGGVVTRGFPLTMTNLAGTIYYTTNGADPRGMFTGAVSSNALTYSGPIALNQSTLIKARSRSGNNWSALTRASMSRCSVSRCAPPKSTTTRPTTIRPTNSLNCATPAARRSTSAE